MLNEWLGHAAKLITRQDFNCLSFSFPWTPLGTTCQESSSKEEAHTKTSWPFMSVNTSENKFIPFHLNTACLSIISCASIVPPLKGSPELLPQMFLIRTSLSQRLMQPRSDAYQVWLIILAFHSPIKRCQDGQSCHKIRGSLNICAHKKIILCPVVGFFYCWIILSF